MAILTTAGSRGFRECMDVRRELEALFEATFEKSTAGRELILIALIEDLAVDGSIKRSGLKSASLHGHLRDGGSLSEQRTTVHEGVCQQKS